MSIQSIGIQEIYTLYQSQAEDHVWIDVRRPSEWVEGTIPGVQRIALDQLPDQLALLDKTKTHVLICRSGGRSSQASQVMESAGFKHLINFDGGMLAWYGAGYPLE